MAIAAGGKIKQAIIPDTYPDDIWRTDNSTFFNIQLVNSRKFKEITDLPTPPTPITYDTYIKAGIPFYSIFNEPSSTISGGFGGVKSLGEIDHTLNSSTSKSQNPSDPEKCAVCLSGMDWRYPLIQ